MASNTSLSLSLSMDGWMGEMIHAENHDFISPQSLISQSGYGHGHGHMASWTQGNRYDEVEWLSHRTLTRVECKSNKGISWTLTTLVSTQPRASYYTRLAFAMHVTPDSPDTYKTGAAQPSGWRALPAAPHSLMLFPYPRTQRTC